MKNYEQEWLETINKGKLDKPIKRWCWFKVIQIIIWALLVGLIISYCLIKK